MRLHEAVILLFHQRLFVGPHYTTGVSTRLAALLADGA
jgi:hypothetical protein